MKNLDEEKRSIRRQLAEKSPWAFAKTYLAHHIKLALSQAHHEIYALLEDAHVHRCKKIVIAAPRGLGKTTMLSLVLLLKAIALREEVFIVLLSLTAAQAEQILSSLKKELETNQRLLEDYPELAGPRPSPWTQSEIETPNNVRILALGVGQHIRGRKYRENRPSLVIADDVESRQSTASYEACQKTHEWYFRDILQVGTDQTNYIFLGTPHSSESLLSTLLDPQKSREWIKRRYSAVVSEPIHPEMWQRWEQIYNGHEAYNGQTSPAAANAYYEDHKALMEEGVKLLWPERWKFQELKILQLNDPVGFASEYLCEPIDVKDCWFVLSDFHYWTRRFTDFKALQSSFAEEMQVFAALDPCTAQSKTHGDRSGFVVLAQSKDGTLYEVLSEATRIPLDALIDRILTYHQIYKFKRFAIETNGFQSYVADQLEKQSRARNIYLPIERIKHTTDKVMRIQRLQPLLRSGAIHLNEHHRELMEEMRFFPRGKFDDLLDSVEMCVQAATKPRMLKLSIVGGNSDRVRDLSAFARDIRTYRQI